MSAVVRLSGPRPAARTLAEGLGTGLLVAVVVGSGIAAERLSPGEVGLQLLENSVATALALAALIVAFGPVSGAHFNPAVTLAELASHKLESRMAARYLGAQIAGGCAGAVIANLMYELPAVELATHDRLSPATFLAEVVATFGLLTVIFGAARSGRFMAVPVAVAGYIGAAYWFTSSTSFANPAVTVARTLSDTFAGIRPASAPGFIVAQLLGAALAVLVARVVFPEPEPSLEEALHARP
ncbi:MAG: MIP/aquaporin family protein [Acidimicrobiales bacterium]